MSKGDIMPFIGKVQKCNFVVFARTHYFLRMVEMTEHRIKSHHEQLGDPAHPVDLSSEAWQVTPVTDLQYEWFTRMKDETPQAFWSMIRINPKKLAVILATLPLSLTGVIRGEIKPSANPKRAEP